MMGSTLDPGGREAAVRVTFIEHDPRPMMVTIRSRID
jgi:hypothetical protein